MMDNNYTDRSDTYFAKLNVEDIGSALKQKIDDYQMYISTFGMLDMWNNVYSKYYVAVQNSGALMNAGSQGELTLLRRNHFRNIVQHVYQMITDEPPAFDCLPVNSDHKSLAQADIGNGLLEYYGREKDLLSTLKKAAEYMLLFGEGFVSTEWNVTAGEPVTPPEPFEEEVLVNEFGEEIEPLRKTTGDIEFNAYTPMDVIRDFRALSAKNADDWCIVRTWKNKWDLAKKYPEQAEEIIAYSQEPSNWLIFQANSIRAMNDSDLIPLYKFYHRRSETLPEGRYVEFINDSIILDNTTLPYDRIPLRRMCGAELIGSIFGYSVAYDLLQLQEALDNVSSIIMTNILTFGVQNILLPFSANIPTKSYKGLQVIRFDPQQGKPESLNLTNTAAEIYNFAATLIGDMERISAINDVIRGNPPPSLESGVALMFMYSQGVQFNSTNEEAYMSVSGNTGTDMINILKTFAKEPIVAEIAGKSKRTLMKEFTGEDLTNINRVIVKPGNPITKNIAGRIQYANDLWEKKLIKTVEQYEMVLRTGNAEDLTQADFAQLMLIKDENEKLTNGNKNGMVRAIDTDQHALHIREHSVIASSTEARNNPELMRALTEHIKEHLDALQNANPTLLGVLGQEASAPAQPNASGATDATAKIANPENLATQVAGNVPLPGMPAPLLEGQAMPPDPSQKLM